MAPNASAVDIDEDQTSLLSTHSVHPSPSTVTKIIKRLRAMTLKLLPVQVDNDTLVDPTSRVITPKVIAAYAKSAGDFPECLPYCLLRARQSFMYDANTNPADYDENVARATACEVLARRIVHRMSPERMFAVMSGRMRFEDWSGDKSALTSALETAIDQHCTIFLSSNEAQQVVNSLWTGALVQHPGEHNDIDYVPYKPKYDNFWGHFDPARLGVPRFQNWFRICIWLFFLFVYSQAVQQPTEQANDPRHRLDEWEWILFIMSFAFAFEDLDKIYATLRFFTWRALSFWHFISVTTDCLLIAAFTFRIIGLKLANDAHAADSKLRSFQILSCVAPLIWMKLITVADGFKYIGTMQICIARMLKESGIFFVLLAIVGIGFTQAMYAIDAADGRTDRGFLIVNNLIQGLLGSPDFGQDSTWALWIYYFWNIFTTVILLNILISLFSSAYEDVTDDASAHFLAFFAGKTVAMIRAPDEFVYPAPFNLIEIALVAPTEWFISKKAYAKYNRIVMSVVFIIPILFVALFESQLDGRADRFLKNMYDHIDEGEEDDPNNQNPPTERENNLEISRVPFDELIEHFPNSYQSMESSILAEIHALSAKVEALQKQISEKK